MCKTHFWYFDVCSSRLDFWYFEPWSSWLDFRYFEPWSYRLDFWYFAPWSSRLDWSQNVLQLYHPSLFFSWLHHEGFTKIHIKNKCLKHQYSLLWMHFVKNKLTFSEPLYNLKIRMFLHPLWPIFRKKEFFSQLVWRIFKFWDFQFES